MAAIKKHKKLIKNIVTLKRKELYSSQFLRIGWTIFRNRKEGRLRRAESNNRVTTTTSGHVRSGGPKGMLGLRRFSNRRE